MEFPREILLEMIPSMNDDPEWENALREAVEAYDQLAERCVMDRAELSLEIANLRARLREIDPSFPTP